MSQYVPVEDIDATGEYNLNLCGFPHDTVEILLPEEFIAEYLNEKPRFQRELKASCSALPPR